jgi:addiction module HigA family antidote
LGVAAAAKAIGVMRTAISGVTALLPPMTLYSCWRFEKAFGGSADMWLRMQAAYDLARVRQHEGQIVVRRLKPSDAPQPA